MNKKEYVRLRNRTHLKLKRASTEWGKIGNMIMIANPWFFDKISWVSNTYTAVPLLTPSDDINSIMLNKFSFIVVAKNTTFYALMRPADAFVFAMTQATRDEFSVAMDSLKRTIYSVIASLYNESDVYENIKYVLGPKIMNMVRRKYEFIEATYR